MIASSFSSHFQISVPVFFNTIINCCQNVNKRKDSMNLSSHLKQERVNIIYEMLMYEKLVEIIISTTPIKFVKCFRNHQK